MTSSPILILKFWDCEWKYAALCNHDNDDDDNDDGDGDDDDDDDDYYDDYDDDDNDDDDAIDDDTDVVENQLMDVRSDWVGDRERERVANDND